MTSIYTDCFYDPKVIVGNNSTSSKNTIANGYTLTYLEIHETANSKLIKKWVKMHFLSFLHWHQFQ